MNTDRKEDAGSGNPNRLAAALIIIVLSSLVWLYRGYVTDDSFITYRYLHNALAGHGLVFNPGYRVWGFSNFLWLALLSPAVAAGADPLITSRVLGILCTVASVLIVLRRKNGFSSSGNLAGALLLATSGAFVVQATGGLETALYTLLIVLGLDRYRRALAAGRTADAVACGVIAACVAMTRPEGVILIMVLLLTLAVPQANAHVSARPTAVRLSLGFFVPYAGFIAAMHHYYGVFWPNPIDAKVGFSGEQLLRGLAYAVEYAVHYPLYPLLFAIALAAFRRTDVATRAIIACAVALTGVAIAAGGDWMRGYRLLHPVIALVSLLVPLITLHLHRIVRGFAPRFGAARRLPGILLAGAILVNVLNLRFDPHVSSPRYHRYVLDGITVGRWMAAHLEPGAVLATNTCGSIAYFSGLPIIDMMGITDRTIARRTDAPEEWRGIETGDGLYVLSRRPDYIQFGSATGSAEPVHLSDIEIYRQEEFWRWYELQSYPVNDTITVQLYRRRPVPLPDPLPEAARLMIDGIAAARMEHSRFRY